MEKREIRKITSGVIVLSIVAMIFSLIPIVAYYIKFKGHQISKSTSDWADFGNFISGTSGVILSFFAVVFALTSIYFTIKIAKFIQHRDFLFIEKQNSAQLDLIKTQSKPYPYIDLSRLADSTSISIQNGGLGPLIIENVKIRNKNGEEFENLKQLLSPQLKTQNINNVQILYNTASNYIIAPNTSRSILHIKPKLESDKNFHFIQSLCRDILKDCELTLECTDIYKNEIMYSKKLSFLKEVDPPTLTIGYLESLS